MKQQGIDCVMQGFGKRVQTLEVAADEHRGEKGKVLHASVAGPIAHNQKDQLREEKG